MNTINSFEQTLTMEGLRNSNSAVSPVKQINKGKESPAKTIITPTGSEVAQDFQKNAAELKADAQQLQKMSDMVMGRKVQFNVNNELDSVVVKIVDANTNQVVKEIPSEDIQKLKINIRRAIGLLFDDLA